MSFAWIRTGLWKEWFDSREFLKENVAQHALEGAQGHNTKMVDAPTMLKTAERC